jgi:hypothetical protein
MELLTMRVRLGGDFIEDYSLIWLFWDDMKWIAAACSVLVIGVFVQTKSIWLGLVSVGLVFATCLFGITCIVKIWGQTVSVVLLAVPVLLGTLACDVVLVFSAYWDEGARLPTLDRIIHSSTHAATSSATTCFIFGITFICIAYTD